MKGMGNFTKEQTASIEQSERELYQLQFNGDVEAAHAQADDILTNLLKELGCNKVVDLFEKIEKWYA